MNTDCFQLAINGIWISTHEKNSEYIKRGNINSGSKKKLLWPKVKRNRCPLELAFNFLLSSSYAICVYVWLYTTVSESNAANFKESTNEKYQGFIHHQHIFNTLFNSNYIIMLKPGFISIVFSTRKSHSQCHTPCILGWIFYNIFFFFLSNLNANDTNPEMETQLDYSKQITCTSILFFV